MVKHKTSPAFGLTPTLPLSQLPHVNSTSATVMAKRKPSCLTCCAARVAYSSPDDLTTTGHRTQPPPLKPVRRSVFEGLRVPSVSAATVSLAFAVIDLELGGESTVLFRRVYDGARREEDTGLGAGAFILRRPHPRRRRPSRALYGRGLPHRLPPRRSKSTLQAARGRARRAPVVQSHERRHRQRASRRAHAHPQKDRRDLPPRTDRRPERQRRQHRLQPVLLPKHRFQPVLLSIRLDRSHPLAEHSRHRPRGATTDAVTCAGSPTRKASRRTSTTTAPVYLRRRRRPIR